MIIGLTGGIASGKSTVVSFLQQQHITVIDADLIARELVTIGSQALTEITDTFGSKMLLPDGSLNRAKLGQLIFHDDQARVKLDHIMQPKIRKEIIRQIKFYQNQTKLLVLDMPLLIEMNYQNLVDQIWLVVVDEEIQQQRLMARNQLTKQEALARINSQLPLAEKRKYADVILNNNQTKEDLFQQVVDQINLLKKEI